MQNEDYAAWIALRAIDDANLKTKFATLAEQRAYLINDAELAMTKANLAVKHLNECGGVARNEASNRQGMRL